MFKTNFEESLGTWTFLYGNHTIEVQVQLTHEHNGYDYVQYGSHGRGYYQIVTATAIPTVDYSPNDESNPNYDVQNETNCRIRAKPSIPDFDVPDDPTISTIDRFLSRFSDLSVSDLKEQKRQKIQKDWNEQYTPAGSAAPLSKQVEETAKPVLEELNLQYKLLQKDIDLEVDVTIEYMDAEVPWTDIDTKIQDLAETIGKTTS